MDLIHTIRDHTKEDVPICFCSNTNFPFEMYNGIGLRTARGSGTNGFVQRNLSYIRPSRVLQFAQKNETEIIEPKIRQQDNTILEHQVRREIEVALIELEEKMEEQGYDKEEIKTRVEAERKMRMESLNEKVNLLRIKEEKAREGEGEELHDYGSDTIKKEWMEMGKKESTRKHSRSRSRSHSRRRNASRSRSRSHKHHRSHRHHRH